MLLLVLLALTLQNCFLLWHDASIPSWRQTIFCLHAGKWHFDAASEDRKKTLKRARLPSPIQTQTAIDDDGFQAHQKLLQKDNSDYNFPAQASMIPRAVLALSNGQQIVKE